MKRKFFSTMFWAAWPLIYVYAPRTKRARMLVIKGDTFLAVEPFFGGKGWQLPGGGVKRGETCKQAAIREVQEEVGLQSREVSLLSFMQKYSEHGIHVWYELYVTSVTSESEVLQNNEIYRYEWLPLTAKKGLTSHALTAVTMYEQGSDLLQ